MISERLFLWKRTKICKLCVGRWHAALTWHSSTLPLPILSCWCEDWWIGWSTKYQARHGQYCAAKGGEGGDYLSDLDYLVKIIHPPPFNTQTTPIISLDNTIQTIDFIQRFWIFKILWSIKIQESLENLEFEQESGKCQVYCSKESS